ncbi:MAG: nucleotidyltransferase family protein [Chloroflexi bacterium]|nr:nucleotidyltransferase family protein [Chloroflexota bacterium]
MSDVSAVLLAAGESTRMGHQKALLPWRGSTLLQYQAYSLLRGGASEVIAVLGYRAETLRPLVQDIPGVTTVLNLRYRTGKTSSIRAGLRSLSPREQMIVVLSVDQPRSPALVQKVIEAHRQRGALITYPAYQGKGGHPTAFSASLLPELMRIRESRQGLREVMERHRSETFRLEVADQEAVLDLNREEDYRRALAAASVK